MRINAVDHLDFLLENIDTFATSIQPLWHPLGFVSCVIKVIPSELTLRVHYWPPNDRRTKNPDWPVHTHSYALSSLVISGKIEDTQYKTTDGEQHSIYKVSYLNENSEIRCTGKKTNAFKCTSDIRTEGEQYRVERGVFHESSVKSTESAVTFVAISEPSSEAPLVLGEDGGQSYPYDRTPFDREEFWSAVRDAISRPIIRNLSKNF